MQVDVAAHAGDELVHPLTACGALCSRVLVVAPGNADCPACLAAIAGGWVLESPVIDLDALALALHGFTVPTALEAHQRAVAELPPVWWPGHPSFGQVGRWGLCKLQTFPDVETDLHAGGWCWRALGPVLERPSPWRSVLERWAWKVEGRARSEESARTMAEEACASMTTAWHRWNP